MEQGREGKGRRGGEGRKWEGRKDEGKRKGEGRGGEGTRTERKARDQGIEIFFYLKRIT